MRVHQFEQEQVLPIGLDEAWEFFSTPRNLDAITPDELAFRIERCDEGPMFEGQIITYRIRLAPLVWTRWVTEIKAVEPRRAFVDEQRAGPYRFWHHRHSFEEVAGGVRMCDVVNYAIGFGPVGELAHVLFVRKELRRIFGYRREILEKRFGKG
ncbi:MAG: SRPBCC family protein [Akkermansiaceae bacterium]|nr:SRPBCC family protein [Akkermansiaceae bacterium]